MTQLSIDGPLAVELTGITKTFPGVVANHDVNLSVRAGTIHAIVGENGAGKSTLMKTLYGMHQPDDGTIVVNGTPHTFKRSPRQRSQGTSSSATSRSPRGAASTSRQRASASAGS